MGGWEVVAANPAPFLSLGVCTVEWLERALPGDPGAVSSGVDGDDLVHLDVRSDNVCFVGDRALLVDWNLAGVGNGLFDVAFWLPSLAFEGGPSRRRRARPPTCSPPASRGFSLRVRVKRTSPTRPSSGGFSVSSFPPRFRGQCGCWGCRSWMGESRQ